MDITIQHPWFRRPMGSIYPPRLFDQYFGEGMFEYDFLPYATSTISPYYRHNLFRNLLESSNSGISEVRSDRDKFTVYLDVKHFSPEEISVKVMDDYIEIQGKHGERQVRMTMALLHVSLSAGYRMPSSVDQSAITSSLSSNGLLTISGPKVTLGPESSRSDRNIPVVRDEKTSSALSS